MAMVHLLKLKCVQPSHHSGGVDDRLGDVRCDEIGTENLEHLLCVFLVGFSVVLDERNLARVKVQLLRDELNQWEAFLAPRPSMMYIAPRRSNGFSWLAWLNMYAESASDPGFFFPDSMSSRRPPTTIRDGVDVHEQ